MAIVLHHSRAKGTAKLVLVGIANHDGDGGAWPSVQTLAKYANVDTRNVQRAIDSLVSLGEVRRDVNGGGTAHTAEHNRPNLYTIALVCPPWCDRTKNHRDTRKGRKNNAPMLAVFDPLAPASPGGASVTTPLAPASPPPLAPASPEPSIEPDQKSVERPSATTDRAREKELDASGAAPRPATAAPRMPAEPALDPCPRWASGVVPHSYAPATGECVDCGASRPALINPETGEVQ